MLDLACVVHPPTVRDALTGRAAMVCTGRALRWACWWAHSFMGRSVWRSRCGRPSCRSGRRVWNNQQHDRVHATNLAAVSMLTGIACCNASIPLELQALAAVAADDAGRLAVHEAGGVPLLIKLMDDGSPNMVRLLTIIMDRSLLSGCIWLCATGTAAELTLPRYSCAAVEHALCDRVGGAAGACRAPQDGHSGCRRTPCPGPPPEGQRQQCAMLRSRQKRAHHLGQWRYCTKYP